MSDGVIIAYSTARKRLKKYYKKIFLHLLDIVCLNSFLLNKKKTIENYTSKLLDGMH